MILYLVENNINKIYYIGITNDLDRRLKEHNTHSYHFTNRMKGNWVLVGYYNFIKDEEAKKEEKRLKKSKNKKYIRWYFTNKIP